MLHALCSLPFALCSLTTPFSPVIALRRKPSPPWEGGEIHLRGNNHGQTIIPSRKFIYVAKVSYSETCQRRET